MKLPGIIDDLINTAISTVMPETFIPALISLNNGKLKIQDYSYDMDSYRHVYVISVGKAAAGMAEALDRIIHPYVTEGIVLTKHISDKHQLDKRYRILEGGHPVPDADSIAGATAIISLADKAESDDLVFFLISGGGSALMSLPLEGIDLETLQSFSDTILSCGADIKEFNILRKHLDGVKGGRLAQHAAPADQITIILSDVVGDPVDIIASGPTVPDFSTYRDAMDILDRYSIQNSFPEAIRNTLKLGLEGIIAETPKSDSPVFKKSDIYIAASNRTACLAAAFKAQKLGYNAQVLNTQLTGEASTVGKMLPSFFSGLKAPGVFIFGGETTVHIHGNGSGGRNQELALAAVHPMAEWQGCTLVTLATDGEDGPTDAAGACVTSETLAKALELGCAPDDYLRNNNAYHFFRKVNGLIQTGPTGTNVCDITFLIKSE